MAAPAASPVSAPVYPLVQRVLHWLVALCLLALLPLGFYIEGYEKEAVDAANAALGPGGFDLLYALHKSFGLTVLGLMVLRLVARAAMGEPAYVRPLPPLLRLASRTVHVLLYVLLIATPVVGWIGVSAYPAPADFWFVADLALPVGENRALSEFLLQDVHAPLAILLAILAAAHVLAALKHRVIDRDEVMGRMIGRGSAGS
ncbi:cytochrome b/b6 domain-containing protein [Albimonas sp. CAU 1670]|uniref:cytochrome b n=1 Tax=Albimonas sp. CAU 1670 TaxID=3032599 RepID=UPI0023D9D5A0|nr:cytochrome b/b6 domain-containing protein [Albimonas sp. CAU 1670]MDF2232033.1 cytochrome b/b6 domain-containing protein [Albimonas sp. CAU 1670]